MRIPAPAPARAPILKALALALLLVACGITGPGDLVPCSGHPTVQLSSRPPLGFTWTPDCGISTLIVTHVPTGAGASEETVWAFQMPQGRTIGPDVAYGQVPAGATELTAAQPLVIGEKYQVSISNVNGAAVLAIGSLEFVYALLD